MECVPTNPVGKILLVDMILNVAKYGGEERFKAQGEWVQRFVNAVAASLKRAVVRIDVRSLWWGRWLSVIRLKGLVLRARLKSKLLF